MTTGQAGTAMDRGLGGAGEEIDVMTRRSVLAGLGMAGAGCARVASAQGNERLTVVARFDHRANGAEAGGPGGIEEIPA